MNVSLLGLCGNTPFSTFKNPKLVCIAFAEVRNRNSKVKRLIIGLILFIPGWWQRFLFCLSCRSDRVPTSHSALIKYSLHLANTHFLSWVFSTNCWSYPRNVRMVGWYSNRPLMEATDNIFFLQQFIRELQSIPRRWFTSCRNLKLPKLWTPQLSFSWCCNRSPCLTIWTISSCLAWSTAPLWLRSQRDEREPVGASSFTSLLLRLEKTNSQENDRRHHYTGKQQQIDFLSLKPFTSLTRVKCNKIIWWSLRKFWWRLWLLRRSGFNCGDTVDLCNALHWVLLSKGQLDVGSSWWNILIGQHYRELTACQGVAEAGDCSQLVSSH